MSKATPEHEHATRKPRTAQSRDDALLDQHRTKQKPDAQTNRETRVKLL
jgi:hypothetical protein